jgi:hypothetical protein
MSIVNSIGDGGNYGFQLTGQCFASIAQPLFLNLVTAIATAWFPLSERDLATTLATLLNPLGSALGQIIPILIVSQTEDKEVHGMVTLLIVELLLCVVPLLLTYLYFDASPPMPPSRSVKLKRTGAAVGAVLATLTTDSVDDRIPLQTISLNDTKANEAELQVGLLEGHGKMHQSTRQLYAELRALFRDQDFVLLFISFSTVEYRISS